MKKNKYICERIDFSDWPLYDEDVGLRGQESGPLSDSTQIPADDLGLGPVQPASVGQAWLDGAVDAVEQRVQHARNDQGRLGCLTF